MPLPLINLANVVLSLARTEPYTVTRQPKAGSSVDAGGIYVRPATSSLSVRGSVQPQGAGAEQDREAAGVDIDEVLVMYTTTELYAGNTGYEADVVDVDGQAFEVQAVQRFGPLGNYWKATLWRKD